MRLMLDERFIIDMELTFTDISSMLFIAVPWSIQYLLF